LQTFYPSKEYYKKLRANDGIAIILVLSILAVVATLAATFLVTSRLETLKTLNFVEGIRASYIAEAGFSHAKGLLREDKGSTAIDEYSETWRAAFSGADVDNDEEGTPEAKWINLINADGEMYGRYAVTVTDEAGQVNINSAGYHNEDELRITEGYSSFEVSLSKLFTALAVPQATIMRDDILTYRYGGNYPGENDSNTDDNNNNIYISNDGLDNDADGIVDEPNEGVNEPEEFVRHNPYPDDRPFFSIFELRNIPSVESEFATIQPYVTAYSFDRNTDKDGIFRVDLNQATALEVMNVFASADLSNEGQLVVNVVDYRDKDFESTALAYDGKIYYGVEGVRINELFVDPRSGYDAKTLTNPTGPGGDWVNAGDHYENSNPTLDEFSRGVWRFGGLHEGNYYIRLFGTGTGDIVGDVKIGGISHTSLEHGEMFVDTVTVGVDGRLDITVYNREVEKGANFTTYFSRFHLIQSPDTEFIELINITNNDIDVSGWTIEGLRKKDLIATIPAGTIIESFNYLVLAVDRDDVSFNVPVNIRSNSISFLARWSGSPIDSDKVVQLEFSDAVSREDDILTNQPSLYDLTVVLKTSDGRVVDHIEYDDGTAANISLERGDPSSMTDNDGDSIFDDFAYSAGFPFYTPLGTPTSQNNNLSISGHIIGGINSEVLVKNGMLANVGELTAVSAKKEWANVSTADLMRFCDRFTTNSYRLEAEGHFSSGSGWQEVSRSSPYTDWYYSSTYGDEGVWLFTRADRFLDGTYSLTLCGEYGEAFSVSLKKADGSWTTPTPPLTPGPDKCVHYGLISVGGEDTETLPSQQIEIKLVNESTTDDCHFDGLFLSPLERVEGRINVNTASQEALMSLPGVASDTAQAIINNRPYGQVNGIGDILNGNILGATESKKKEIFKKICNLITIKSDVYEVIVRGQAFRKGKMTAEKRLRVIVER